MLQLVPQGGDVPFVAGGLGSKSCSSAKTMYDLLPLSWALSGALALRCMTCDLQLSRRSGAKMYDWLPVLRLQVVPKC